MYADQNQGSKVIMPFKLFVDAAGVPYSDCGIYHGLNIGNQRSVLSVAERGIY
jgi:hypothetical protein